MLKAPQFWQTKNIWAFCLLPLGWLYGIIVAWRIKTVQPFFASVPVICVGNLSLGGAGKTPTVIALTKILQSLGKKPHIISRGYGGGFSGRVLPEHDFRAVGDEPLLLAAHAPCWVGKDRIASAKSAIAAGADILLLDDGFQNPQLHKDIALLVVDGGVGFGNGWVFPAGMLREPVAQGIKRAQGVIVIGEAKTELSFAPDIAVLSASLKTPNSHLQSKRLLAFAGIARPQKFYDSLQQAGAKMVAQFDFPDHHPFSASELQMLQAQAKKLDATLITTEKDAVRLPKDLKNTIMTLPVELSFDKLNQDKLLDILREKITCP